MNILKNIFILAVFFAILIGSCTESKKELGNFKLLPQPMEFKITGVSNLGPEDLLFKFSEAKLQLPPQGQLLSNIQQTEDSSLAQVVCKIDQSMDVKAEGYILDILEDRINIVAKDQPGLFYAFMTLEQLFEDALEQKVNFPLCRIKDEPKLAYRSIHLDMKHHMENTDYYYRMIDRLARYKVNGIIAEMEDKLAYQRQPVVASEDALSISEWKKLSDYAKARNIEISPLIQGLGHASFVLKHEAYLELRDDPESDWAFDPLNPKTYEVQFDLYLDAIEATPHGKYLHVGGDEVHTTGRQSGKSALELQLIWLNKVCEFAEENNRIPIFWDDMPLKEAGVYSAMFNSKLTEQQVDSLWEKNEPKLLEFLDKFPKNCIYMRWNYSDSDAVGNEKAMEWFRKNGLQVMGATAGQTRWVLMPQQESNMNNIRAFATSSIDKGLHGLLLTLWDDDSPHFELYNRGIIAFAEYTWSGEKRSKSELKAAYRHREFSSVLGDSAKAFIDRLERPVGMWKNILLKGNKRNYLASQENPLAESVIDLPNKDDKGAWSEKNSFRIKRAQKMVEESKEISQKIKVMQSKAIRNKNALEVYEQVSNLVRFSSNMILLLHQYDQAKNEEEEKATIDQLKNLRSEFEVLRVELESVYGRTRILTKPAAYILDQDHHVHLANQSRSFDWQFGAELLFLEKVEAHDFSRSVKP